MAKHIIILKNGFRVNLDTDMSLRQMKKFKSKGLLDKNFIGKLALLEVNPKEFEMDDLENALYLAYLNADNEVSYTQEEFESLVPYDLGFYGEIFSEMLQGETKKGEMQKEFIKKTSKKDNNKGKKFPK